MKNNPKLSIIIPVLNEESTISKLIKYIKTNSHSNEHIELLVIDGGSTDATVELVKKEGVTVLSYKKGRAKQMNFGAQKAKGKLLYFLHADTFPPKHFDYHILNAITDGNEAGCFQMKFDSNNWVLRFFAWFTRFNHKLCRGGDQSLFIKNKLFKQIKGFNEEYVIFEDNEFIGRLYQKTNFKILPFHVRTSARKYREMGVIKLQYHFGMIHLKNYLGAGPERLYAYYKRNISI